VGQNLFIQILTIRLENQHIGITAIPLELLGVLRGWNDQKASESVGSVRRFMADANEIVTVELSREQILHEIDLLGKLLESRNVQRILVEYGWGSNLDPSSLWQPHDLPIQELPNFVATAERTGIYKAGSADLIVRDAKNEFTLLLCHESDIHLTTANADLRDTITRNWLERGIAVRRKGESGEWTTIQPTETYT
jgi:hypothetical protein